MFVSCGLEKGAQKKAIKAIYREIDAMKKGEFTDNELKNAKQSILRSMTNVSGSLGSLGGYMLGQALLEDGVSFEENLALVESVTREEVIAFANTVTPELEYILGD
jgi:predicted Zn-dependent peptidase